MVLLGCPSGSSSVNTIVSPWSGQYSNMNSYQLSSKGLWSYAAVVEVMKGVVILLFFHPEWGHAKGTPLDVSCSTTEWFGTNMLFAMVFCAAIFICLLYSPFPALLFCSGVLTQCLFPVLLLHSGVLPQRSSPAWSCLFINFCKGRKLWNPTICHLVPITLVGRADSMVLRDIFTDYKFYSCLLWDA